MAKDFEIKKHDYLYKLKIKKIIGLFYYELLEAIYGLLKLFLI